MALSTKFKNLLNKFTNIGRDTELGTILDTMHTKVATMTGGATTQYVRGNGTLATLMTDVRATTLTGLALNNADVVATDTTLVAIGKLQGQIDPLQVAKLVSIVGEVSAPQINAGVVTLDLGAVYTVMGAYFTDATGTLRTLTKIQNLTNADETKIAFTVTDVATTDLFKLILKVA